MDSTYTHSQYLSRMENTFISSSSGSVKDASLTNNDVGADSGLWLKAELIHVCRVFHGPGINNS